MLSALLRLENAMFTVFCPFLHQFFMLFSSTRFLSRHWLLLCIYSTLKKISTKICFPSSVWKINIEIKMKGEQIFIQSLVAFRNIPYGTSKISYNISYAQCTNFSQYLDQSNCTEKQNFRALRKRIWANTKKKKRRNNQDEFALSTNISTMRRAF